MLALFLLNARAVNAQLSVYNNDTTIWSYHKTFTDSLLTEGVDTLISYFRGFTYFTAISSVSCPVAYVYWVDDGSAWAVEIKPVRIVKKRKRAQTLMGVTYSPYLGYTPILFADRYFKEIETAVMDFSPASRYIVNKVFEKTTMTIGKRAQSYTIDTAERGLNLLNYKVLFIDNLLAFLFMEF